MNWTRGGRSLACAAALGAAAPALADGPARLAATLVAAGDAAALVEFPGGQRWLRAGDEAGGCRLLQVDGAAADLDCGGRPLRLELEAGAGKPVAAPPDSAMANIELPAGKVQSLAARPQAIALAADFAPLVEDGQLRGWRVDRLDETGPLAGFGLREADVIQAVNGAPAAEPAAFAAALRALPSTYAFTLELFRDGQPLTLTVAAPPAAGP
ncbi:hypothetical protein [Thioalkalivibrio sp. XN8]|uniref:hypothetical protein n=1 Tax=Thioalkalivibrio sp. XN8 TaxID=2712863 RepID=UPI0013EA206C|nr:hypothetical protein [Thioalkalivibrio sp. XN8]NGP53093.1 hypothetical protein [Thioalkalivibrio sp. XN8]